MIALTLTYTESVQEQILSKAIFSSVFGLYANLQRRPGQESYTEHPDKISQTGKMTPT